MTEVLPLSTYGHSSVIVFFVLSGFVIAYITDTKENTLPSYSASRVSRIYSVALPAVLLTLALDAVGRQLYPALYDLPFDQFLVRIASSLLLLNEIWFVSITSFSNVPYWSICYEMWYYVGFALIVFFPGRRGIAAAALLGLVLGPKLLLLAPVWGAGVLLYHWKALARFSEPVGWLLALGSALGIVLFHQAGVDEHLSEWFKALIGPYWHTQLTFSKFFLGDWLLGLLVFLNFAGMRIVSVRLAPALLAVERPVRIVAGYTLTLYLLHQPLFLFWAAVLRGDPAGYGYWWAVTALVALSVALAGRLTERKRGALRRWLQQRFSELGQRWSSWRPAASSRP
ncbi:MAG: acyltransferase family protein [Burkholderiales bacterium]